MAFLAWAAVGKPRLFFTLIHAVHSRDTFVLLTLTYRRRVVFRDSPSSRLLSVPTAGHPRGYRPDLVVEPYTVVVQRRTIRPPPGI